ncbi:MAG: zinc-binding dehydrogenase [Acidimicrobiales bacterium]
MIVGENGGRLFGGLDRQLRAVAWSTISRQTLTTFVASEHFVHLERLAGLVESGAVRPIIDRRYALEDAPEAFRRLANGEVRGKAVLEIVPGR